MMRKMIAATVAALLASGSANAATVFGVDEFNNLVRFDSSAPGTSVSTAITGIADSLFAIDFRPLNNTLYGLGSDRVIYTINTGTGAASAISGPLDLTGTEFAFDFNPTIDRLRIVSNTNQNYVFNPNDGTLQAPATPVFFANGDVNQGANPDVVAGAYTSSTFGSAPATTQLYGIDTRNDVLVRQANSAGTLNTVGALGFNLGTRTSFDIAGSDAFAFNGTSLYSVNLSTGGLTTLGSTDRQLFAIAIGAVPEPTTWAMMVLGFGSIGYSLRSRRRKTTLATA